MNRSLLTVLAVALAVACTPRPTTPSANPSGEASSAESVDAEPWRAQVPKPGRLSRISQPVPEQRKLDNGLEVLVVRQPVQIVALLALVRRGGDSVPAGKSGLAALTARMLTEGTNSRSSEQLAVAAENLGSELQADAGRDYSLVAMTVLRDDLDRAMELVAEVLREPAFDPKELERVRSEWVDQLVAERQSPDRLCTLAALRLLLGPVRGAPVGGSIRDVKQLTAADLHEFYQSHYAPAETAVVAVGDVTVDEVHASAARHFGSWRATARNLEAAPVPAPANQRRRIVLVDRPDAVQSALCAVQPMPPRSAPGHEAREVLNTLLGGMFTSRLNQNLRERHGYTYGAGSAAVATRSWGAYLVMTTVDAAATQASLTEVVRELEGISHEQSARPPTATELDRAKAALINGQAAQLERASSVAFDLAQLFVHELPRDYFVTYADKIQAVTREAVLTEARRHLRAERLGVVIVGPRQTVEPGLQTPQQTVESAHPSLLE